MPRSYSFPSHTASASAGYNVSVDHVHLKLRFKRAERDKIDLFHALMNKLDKDYPIDPGSNQTFVHKCKSCGGLFWRRPVNLVNVKILKRLATQLGLQMKVQGFLQNCKGATEPVAVANLY